MRISIIAPCHNEHAALPYFLETIRAPADDMTAKQGVAAFSTVPLSIASVMGVIFCLIAVIGILVIPVKALIWGGPAAGFPTLACLLLFIGGSIQMSLGILEQYLAKTYLETKRRPVYIVAERDKEAPHEEIL